MSDIGVVVFHHEILISRQSLLCYYTDFVDQIQLKANGFILPLCVVPHSIACESYFRGDNNVIPIC